MSNSKDSAQTGVRNRTVYRTHECHAASMPRTNPKINAATLASVKKEMAQPRVAASARISEPPRVSLPGMVDEIIPANALQSEDGDAVGLKLGAKAEVIIEANSKSTAKK